MHSSVGPFGLGVEPDALAPGRGDREPGIGLGRDRLQRDQVDAPARSEAGGPALTGDVAGVAAAGYEQQVGLRPPTVGLPGAELLGEVLERPDAGVRAPVGDAAGVVVAVVRGGPLVDRAVGADPKLN
jgi:hypothetical protein